MLIGTKDGSSLRHNEEAKNSQTTLGEKTTLLMNPGYLAAALLSLGLSRIRQLQASKTVRKKDPINGFDSLKNRKKNRMLVSVI